MHYFSGRQVVYIVYLVPPDRSLLARASNFVYIRYIISYNVYRTTNKDMAKRHKNRTKILYLLRTLKNNGDINFQFQ